MRREAVQVTLAVCASTEAAEGRGLVPVRVTLDTSSVAEQAVHINAYDSAGGSAAPVADVDAGVGAAAWSLGQGDRVCAIEGASEHGSSEQGAVLGTDAVHVALEVGSERWPAGTATDEGSAPLPLPSVTSVSPTEAAEKGAAVSCSVHGYGQQNCDSSSETPGQGRISDALRQDRTHTRLPSDLHAAATLGSPVATYGSQACAAASVCSAIVTCPWEDVPAAFPPCDVGPVTPPDSGDCPWDKPEGRLTHMDGIAVVRSSSADSLGSLSEAQQLREGSHREGAVPVDASCTSASMREQSSMHRLNVSCGWPLMPMERDEAPGSVDQASAVGLCEQLTGRDERDQQTADPYEQAPFVPVHEHCAALPVPQKHAHAEGESVFQDRQVCTYTAVLLDAASHGVGLSAHASLTAARGHGAATVTTSLDRWLPEAMVGGHSEDARTGSLPCGASQAGLGTAVRQQHEVLIMSGAGPGLTKSSMEAGVEDAALKELLRDESLLLGQAVTDKGFVARMTAIQALERGLLNQ
jgi:hypothetical protein